MNSYKLSRDIFDWSFENPDKITPNHLAIFFFAVEHCNRLGWKDKYGFPTSMVMEAVGIKSYNTYIKAFEELVQWGFISLISKSKNQYSSNVIALSKNNKATDKALDKALTKHLTKQSESTIQSTGESISSIDKQYNKEQKTIPPTPYEGASALPELSAQIAEYQKANPSKYPKDLYERFQEYWGAPVISGRGLGKPLWRIQKTWVLTGRLATWNGRNKPQTPITNAGPRTKDLNDVK